MVESPRASRFNLLGKAAQIFVVANEFHLVAFWIVKVERSPLDPFVFCGLNVQAQCLKPLLFGVVVGFICSRLLTRRATSPSAFTADPLLILLFVVGAIIKTSGDKAARGARPR
jgi:uncharacterized membrane protein YbjE (DUF340 family)